MRTVIAPRAFPGSTETAGQRHDEGPRGRGGLRAVLSDQAVSGQASPALASHVLATSLASFLSTTTCLTMSARAAVSSLAETELRTVLTLSAFSVRTSGTTLSEPKRLCGSASTTKPLAAIDGSVRKMLAALTWPFFRASTVAWLCSGRNSLGVML